MDQSYVKTITNIGNVGTFQDISKYIEYPDASREHVKTLHWNMLQFCRIHLPSFRTMHCSSLFKLVLHICPTVMISYPKSIAHLWVWRFKWNFRWIHAKYRYRHVGIPLALNRLLNFIHHGCTDSSENRFECKQFDANAPVHEFGSEPLWQWMNVYSAPLSKRIYMLNIYLSSLRIEIVRKIELWLK